MLPSKILSFSKIIAFFLTFHALNALGQTTKYIHAFDYKNINTSAMFTVQGLNDTQNHVFTLLKHSFEMQHIISHTTDTLFAWNGLIGRKTIYTKDSLILFFVRPNDTITRPCILLTHGNGTNYRSSWSEICNSYTIDLAMRGFCVTYYENPSSFESSYKLPNNTRKAFYSGFQAAVAANLYAIKNAQLLKIDTTKLFAGGLSFGAFCSLSLASANIGSNFTDTLFSRQGNFSATSIYNTSFRKNIKNTFAIGGGLPKDDTIAKNNSKMGNFLDEEDNNLSVLFLHGRNDNLVTFDLTAFGNLAIDSTLFYVEGPRRLISNIKQKGLPIQSKIMVNCKGGHPFITTVCGNSQPNCIQQYQWLYLNEPPNGVTSTSPYFTNLQNDTLLHYFTYLIHQIDDVDYLISDFLQPVTTSNTSSIYSEPLYFVQPQDSFTFTNSSVHYIFKNTDCEGNSYVIPTFIHNPIITKNEITIYPNPTTGFITIETKENMEKISIYSMLGALAKEIICNDNQQQLDIRELTNGEYICVIQLKEKVETKKISVIR